MKIRLIPSCQLRITRLCRSLALLPLVALGLCLFPQNQARAAVEYMIQISVDGLRGDLLQDLVANSPSSFPNFQRLQTEGASTYNARCDWGNSSTIPNHSGMVTGRPLFQPPGQPNTVHHGYTRNFPGPNDTYHNAGNTNVSYMFSVFDVTHDHGLRTAYFAGKTRLEIIRRSYNAANGGPDTIGEDNGNNKIDESLVGNSNTPALVATLTDLMTNNPPNYVFLHLVEPDIPGGHTFGWGSDDWGLEVMKTDAFLGDIFQAIAHNPALQGKTAIVLTADHGGGGEVINNHRDETRFENFVIPFFVWGPDVPAGANLYDLIPNRVDPGLEYLDYADDSQPLWNNDSANMAMSLMGLPQIPGSYLVPDFGSPVLLDIALNNNQVEISWPARLDNFVLESSPTLTPPVWNPVIADFVVDEDSRKLVFPAGSAPTTQFYQLREAGFDFVSHPQSVTTNAGSQARFAVSLDGAGSFTYQWQKDGVALPGETAAELVLGTVMPSDEGDYSVLASDGVDVLVSNPATLTVTLGPIITQHPMSQVVDEAAPVVFSVTATGGTLSYQWRKDGSPIAGNPLAPPNTLLLGLADISNEGSYDVVVSDEFGSTTSDPATLTVVVPLSITQDLAPQTVTVGDTVTLTVGIEGNPAPFHYRWRRGSTTVRSEFSVEKTADLVLTNVQLTDAGLYSVNITNNFSGFRGILSSRVQLTVEEPSD